VKCVDVEVEFAAYRIGYEDPQFSATQDPWHKILVCRHGHISPAGGSKLWACTKNNGQAATALRSGDYPCEVKMDGDDGVNAEFDVKDAPVFLKLMGAKR
jgi:hypothetical protein